MSDILIPNSSLSPESLESSKAHQESEDTSGSEREAEGGTDAIGRGIHEISELLSFIELSIDGFDYSTVKEVVIERVKKYPGSRYDDQSYYQESIEKAKKHKLIANRNEREGFTYLYGLAVVRSWSILEASIEDYIASELHEIMPTHDRELLHPLKGSLVDFLEASAEERAWTILSLLKQATKPNRSLGVDKFEALLKAVGLSGSMDKRVRKTLRELWAVRNLIVHRGGLVDARFVEICPWIQASVGEGLLLKGSIFRRYVAAIYWYLGELRCRIAIRDKTPSSEFVEDPELQSMLLSIIDENESEKPSTRDIVFGSA